MTDDMADGIVEVLKRLGYSDVHSASGVVYYTEIDGTKHYLLEHDC